MPLITKSAVEPHEGEASANASRLVFSHAIDAQYTYIQGVEAFECPPTTVCVRYRRYKFTEQCDQYKLKVPWQYLVAGRNKFGNVSVNSCALFFAHERVVKKDGPVFVPPLPNITTFGTICFGGHLDQGALDGLPIQDQMFIVLNHFWMSPFTIGAWPGRKSLPTSFRKPQGRSTADLTTVFEDWEAHDRQGLKIKWKRFYYRGRRVNTMNDALTYVGSH